MTPLARAYARWAREADFVEDGHDAAYRGFIDGVIVRIDNGVRASGFYKVDVAIAIATGAPAGVVGADEASPLRAALFACSQDEEDIVGIRVDVDALALRLAPETPPDHVSRIAQRVIDLCRRPNVEPSGPYR